MFGFYLHNCVGGFQNIPDVVCFKMPGVPQIFQTPDNPLYRKLLGVYTAILSTLSHKT